MWFRPASAVGGVERLVRFVKRFGAVWPVSPVSARLCASLSGLLREVVLAALPRGGEGLKGARAPSPSSLIPLITSASLTCRKLPLPLRLRPLLPSFNARNMRRGALRSSILVRPSGPWSIRTPRETGWRSSSPAWCVIFLFSLSFF